MTHTSRTLADRWGPACGVCRKETLLDLETPVVVTVASLAYFL